MTNSQNLNKAQRLLYISSDHLSMIRSQERTQYVQGWIMSHIKRHEAIVRHYNECKLQSGMLNSLTRSYFGAPQLNDNN